MKKSLAVCVLILIILVQLFSPMILLANESEAEIGLSDAGSTVLSPARRTKEDVWIGDPSLEEPNFSSYYQNSWLNYNLVLTHLGIIWIENETMGAFPYAPLKSDYYAIKPFNYIQKDGFGFSGYLITAYVYSQEDDLESGEISQLVGTYFFPKNIADQMGYSDEVMDPNFCLKDEKLAELNEEFAHLGGIQQVHHFYFDLETDDYPAKMAVNNYRQGQLFHKFRYFNNYINELDAEGFVLSYDFPYGANPQYTVVKAEYPSKFFLSGENYLSANGVPIDYNQDVSSYYTYAWQHTISPFFPYINISEEGPELLHELDFPLMASESATEEENGGLRLFLLIDVASFYREIEENRIANELYSQPEQVIQGFVEKIRAQYPNSEIYQLTVNEFHYGGIGIDQYKSFFIPTYFNRDYGGFTDRFVRNESIQTEVGPSAFNLLESLVKPNLKEDGKRQVVVNITRGPHLLGGVFEGAEMEVNARKRSEAYTQRYQSIASDVDVYSLCRFFFDVGEAYGDQFPNLAQIEDDFNQATHNKGFWTFDTVDELEFSLNEIATQILQDVALGGKSGSSSQELLASSSQTDGVALQEEEEFIRIAEEQLAFNADMGDMIFVEDYDGDGNLEAYVMPLVGEKIDSIFRNEVYFINHLGEVIPVCNKDHPRGDTRFKDSQYFTSQYVPKIVEAGPHKYLIYWHNAGGPGISSSILGSLYGQAYEPSLSGNVSALSRADEGYFIESYTYIEELPDGSGGVRTSGERYYSYDSESRQFYSLEERDIPQFIEGQAIDEEESLEEDREIDEEESLEEDREIDEEESLEEDREIELDLVPEETSEPVQTISEEEFMKAQELLGDKVDEITLQGAEHGYVKPIVVKFNLKKPYTCELKNLESLSFVLSHEFPFQEGTKLRIQSNHEYFETVEMDLAPEDNNKEITIPYKPEQNKIWFVPWFGQQDLGPYEVVEFDIILTHKEKELRYKYYFNLAAGFARRYYKEFNPERLTDVRTILGETEILKGKEKERLITNLVNEVDLLQISGHEISKRKLRELNQRATELCNDLTVDIFEDGLKSLELMSKKNLTKNLFKALQLKYKKEDSIGEYHILVEPVGGTAFAGSAVFEITVTSSKDTLLKYKASTTQTEEVQNLSLKAFNHMLEAQKGSALQILLNYFLKLNGLDAEKVYSKKAVGLFLLRASTKLWDYKQQRKFDLQIDGHIFSDYYKLLKMLRKYQKLADAIDQSLSDVTPFNPKSREQKTYDTSNELIKKIRTFDSNKTTSSVDEEFPMLNKPMSSVEVQRVVSKSVEFVEVFEKGKGNKQFRSFGVGGLLPVKDK